MLRLAEDLLYFVIDKQASGGQKVPDRALHNALAGSVLMDLALEDRIDSDLDRVILVDSTPVGDDLLDPMLEMIASAPEGRDAAWWVEKFAHPDIAGELHRRTIARLLNRSIIEADLEGNLVVSEMVARTRRYPNMQGPRAVDADLRVVSVLFTDDVPHPQDAMLVALIDACGLIAPFLTLRERGKAEARIDLIRRLDLVGRAVGERMLKLDDDAQREEEDEGQEADKAAPGVARALLDGVRRAVSFGRSKEAADATDDAAASQARPDDDSAPSMPTFAEELLIFLLDKDSGHLANMPDRVRHHAMAAAVLMDLTLAERIDSDLERLLLVDSTPTGDDLLDPALALIAADTESRDTTYWIERLGTEEIAERVQEAAIARLVDHGILERLGGGFLSLTRLVRRARRYPVAGGQAGREVGARIMGILFADDVPEPRDAMLIALVDACGIFDRMLSPDEREQVGDRIDLLRSLDLIGRTVGESIRRLEAPDPGDADKRVIPGSVERRQALAKQPMVPGGVPILGHGISLGQDPNAFLTKQYLALGPVFRVRIPGGPMTVLAGPEANNFLQKEGRLHLRSYNAMGPLVRHLGAHRAVLNMDGNEHFRLRKAMTKSFSHAHLLKHLGTTCDVAAQELTGWTAGRPVPVVPALRRIFVEQTAQVCTGTTALPWVDDLTHHIDTIIAVFSRRAHKSRLNSRRARRARDNVARLAENVLNAHDPDERDGSATDMIDDMIDLHRSDPQFLPQNELRQTTLMPFLAGLHTATATVVFMLYEVLRNPETRAAVQSEADELFAGEGPTPEKLRRMDVTHRALMETLRLYPVGGILLRDVVNTFELAGHTIPFGEQIMIPVAVPHFCEEYYPDPLRFDIDRYLPERNEHRQRGAFAPFGAGTHRCIGSRFTEVQVALTTATLLNRADISLDPEGYRMKTKYSPLLAPAGSFNIRVAPRS